VANEQVQATPHSAPDLHRYLGHNSPQTTALYTHLTVEANEQAGQIIEQVVSRLAW